MSVGKTVPVCNGSDNWGIHSSFQLGDVVDGVCLCQEINTLWQIRRWSEKIVIDSDVDIFNAVKVKQFRQTCPLCYDEETNEMQMQGPSGVYW